MLKFCVKSLLSYALALVGAPAHLLLLYLLMHTFLFSFHRDGTKLSKRQNDITVEHFKVSYIMQACSKGFEFTV